MPYNIFGWDTTYAIDVANINAALAKNAAPSVKYNNTQSKISIDGQLASMQVVPGGSGKKLRFSFPFKSGTIKSELGTAKLDGVAVIADLELSLLPSNLANQKNFATNPKTVSKTLSGPGILNPVNLLDPNHNLSAGEHGLAFAMLPLAIASIADKLTYALAIVNFAKPKSNSWLAPVDVDYAYMAKNSGKDYLGIFATVSQRDVSKLSRQIDNSIVSGANNAGLFISDALFMEHIIMPSIPAAYPGTSAANFRWTGSEIVSTGSFGLPSVKSGLIRYYPRMDSFSMKLSSNKITTVYNGSCDLKAGISMTFNGQDSSSAHFNSSSKSFTFTPDGNSQFHHDAHIPWYWIGGGAIVELIVQIVSRVIASSIAGSLQSSQPSTLARTPPTSINFPDTTPMDVKDMGLNGVFYMQGTVANK